MRHREIHTAFNTVDREGIETYPHRPTKAVQSGSNLATSFFCIAAVHAQPTFRDLHRRKTIAMFLRMARPVSRSARQCLDLGFDNDDCAEHACDCAFPG